jgi:hypothetical protein
MDWTDFKRSPRGVKTSAVFSCRLIGVNIQRLFPNGEVSPLRPSLFRDMHTAPQQARGRQTHYETISRVLFGLAPDTLMFAF